VGKEPLALMYHDCRLTRSHANLIFVLVRIPGAVPDTVLTSQPLALVPLLFQRL